MGWVPQICSTAVAEILSNCSTHPPFTPLPPSSCDATLGESEIGRNRKRERERWNSHPWFRSRRTLGKAGSYYHSKFAMCRVEEIRCVLPLKCIFQPLCDGKFHQVLEGAVIRGTGYECCGIKRRHLSNKMKHSQTPAKWKKIYISPHFSSVIHDCVSEKAADAKIKRCIGRLG